MLLVVGLGNPGTKYERNRHNIGFSAVDAIAEKQGASAWIKKFRGELCETKIPDGNMRIFFLKPQTYMNLSGESLAAATHFYKIPPEKIIVIHDDLDLLPGKLRVKQGGGNGGHNGLKSIDAYIGADYWRVRIGIGRPDTKDRVADYVLENFTKEDIAIQQKMLAALTSHFSLLINGNIPEFMNRVAVDARV